MVMNPREIVSRWKPKGPMTSALLGLRRKPPRLPILKSSAVEKVYGRVGPLEVRLAGTRGDLKRAQRLRYNVFYREMSATPDMLSAVRRRDRDGFDAFCDHLLVVDTTPHPMTGFDGTGWRRKPRVVGTYRVLRDKVAKLHGRTFYTQGEYDIAPLIAARPDTSFMELGRSCVLKPYRNKRTLELLWHGLWTYVRENGVDVMIGCASFEGTNPQAHAEALSFLYHHSLAPPEWRVKAHDRLYQSMNLKPKESVDMKAALKAMPPLIKGYLRLGAYVGEGAVIDRQFGTTDVMIILPVERIDPRYFAHFGKPEELTSRISAGAGRVM